jgi:hypothetical protein
MFRKFALAVSLSVFVMGAARADILCSALGGPQNVAIADFSCSLGGLTFSDFQVLPAAGNPNPEIDLTGATIAADGTVNLNLNPNMSAPPGGGFQDIDFYFTVTGGIDQIDLAVGGVNATISERVCDATFNTDGNICAGNQLASIVAFSTPPGPSTAISQFFNTTSPLYVFKDINVAPGEHGGALTSFSQSFHPDASVPEPSSISLLGLVLIGLSFFGRRLQKS